MTEERFNDLVDNYLRYSCRNGMGLTEACDNLGESVEEVSDMLHRYPDRLTELKQECRLGYQKALSVVNELAITSDKGVEWLKAVTTLKSMAFRIVLWSEYLNQRELNPVLVASLLNSELPRKEIATGLGMDAVGLEIYIMQHPNIKHALT